MPRKPDRDKAARKPSPECEEAFAAIIETAHRCAADILGEKPAADPEKHASPVALHHAMAMLYFLCRIDPKHMAALACGPGSFADFAHRPFPPLPGESGRRHGSGKMPAGEAAQSPGTSGPSHPAPGSVTGG